MSLTSNANRVAFAAPHFNYDKIVAVFEGSFNRATDVIEVVGDAGSIYVYRIAHGFTRPVFPDLIWKISGNWTDSGCSDGTDISIAYSDSTYIYVVSSVFSTASGTFQYKVIATWIDDYDGTNPTVGAFHDTTKAILFDSRANYQKIHDQGELSFASASTQNVSHGLGYRANFRVFYEALPGQVWPAFYGGASNPFLYQFSMSECMARMTSSALAIELFFVSSTKRVWYKIYLDQ